jgi:pimeloyl-ACP methyl ester carboxylesterase
VVDRPRKRKAPTASAGNLGAPAEFTTLSIESEPVMNRHATLAPRRTRPRRRFGPLLAAGAVATAAAAAATYARAKRAERRYPPTGRIVDVGGIGVHVHVAGEGPPLVLLNGNGTMVHDWIISGLVDRLARRYRVIAIDRPGYGYSERPHGRFWTARAQADLLRRTLARLGVERPVVLGHSWGTLVALALALDHPEAVRGLVLLSGYYFPTGRLDVWAFAPPAIPVVGDLMRYTVSPALGRMIAPKLIARMFEPLPVPRRFATRFPLDLALRPWAIRASAEDSALMVPGAAGLHERYRELDLPVAILSGAADRVINPKRQAVRLADRIADSELTLVPGVGHMIHYAAQDEIAHAVGRVSSRSGTDSAFRKMEASPGIEPGCKDLQSSA